MSKTNFKDKKGQSFKAVENCLRRLAYNLGNSPSQTEVKIVSCIPIDVTDLQQRIFQLQTELADYKCAKVPTQTVGSVVCAKRNDKGPTQVFCNECLLTTTSVLSVNCPGNHSLSNLRSGSSGLSRRPDPLDNTEGTDKPITERQSKSKHLFSKKKKECKNRNLKTQLVYHAYADTDTPFRHGHNVNIEQYSNATEHDRKEILDRSFLADVVHRQYLHQPYLENSNLSDISSPVCRDDTLFPCDNSPHSKSDVCSCCHGQFQNVDDYMVNRNKPNIFATNENIRNHQRIYYNSNFYDVIPVKEKSVKNFNNTKIQKAKYIKKEKAKEIDNQKSIYNHERKEIKNPTIKCWPGKTRLKYRKIPTVVNYCSQPPHRTERADSPARSPLEVADRRRASTPRATQQDIDYSPIYPIAEKSHAERRQIATKRVHHVATSSPGSVNMANRQTVTTITDDTLSGDKTETTLNQIKDILQSVLTEVKTSGKMVSPSERPKKDAVVQNAPGPASRGYEYGASRLLQSYTYSPYNMHMNHYNVNRMPYKPSCSHPMAANRYTTAHMYPEYPGVPAIPVQQYPLLIQPQKHMCNSYYGNNNRTITKHATSAATNTEQAKEHSKETERLIKEIYKSIALNIEESSKDNSVLEYMKAKSITDKYVNITKSESDTESVRVAKAISEIFKNTNMQDSTATGTTGSNNSYEDDKKSRRVFNRPDSRAHRTERVYAQKETSKYANEKSERKSHYQHSTEELSDNTVINEESEESSSESETDDAVEVKKEPAKTVPAEPVKIKEHPKVAEPKKEKSGLFKKVLKIFQPRPRRRYDRRDSVTNDSEPASESDSDDYQTIYSQKIADTTPKKQVTIRSRPHSNVFYGKQGQHRSRSRSPEKHTRAAAPYTATTEIDSRYKRCREEKRQEERMYENQRHSSRYPTRGTGDRDRRRYAYYQNYVARPILVHHNNRMPQRMPVAAPRPYYTPNCSPYNTHRVNFNLSDERYSYAAKAHASPARPVKPHYVASKNNAKRGLFSKALKKTKMNCGICGQDWKDLIING